MSQKKRILLGVVAGSIVGGYLPALAGLDGPMISLLGSFVGGIVGLWAGYRFGA